MVPKSMPTVGQLVFMERPEYVRTTKYIFYSNCSIPLYVSMQGTPYEFGTLFSRERH